MGVEHIICRSSHITRLCRQLIKFLSTEARRAGKLREKLEKVEVWTQQRRIPSALTRRIRAYYAEIWLDFAGELIATIIALG